MVYKSLCQLRDDAMAQGFDDLAEHYAKAAARHSQANVTAIANYLKAAQLFARHLAERKSG